MSDKAPRKTLALYVTVYDFIDGNILKLISTLYLPMEVLLYSEDNYVVKLDFSTQEFYHIKFDAYHIASYFEGENFSQCPVKNFLERCKREDQAIRENYPREMYM